ncbi:MAG: helix-turn-helix domain-containing protein [Clostridiales bacterium]|nr:helix-turn-helix domain-containing protein [Clostridiales bacterium]
MAKQSPKFDEKFIRERIALLITQKGISATKMSREMGYGKGYFSDVYIGKQSIPYDRLFATMEYLEVTPRDFFDTELPYPTVTRQLCEECRKLDIEDQKSYLEIFKRQNKKNGKS